MECNSTNYKKTHLFRYVFNLPIILSVSQFLFPSLLLSSYFHAARFLSQVSFFRDSCCRSLRSAYSIASKSGLRQHPVSEYVKIRSAESTVDFHAGYVPDSLFLCRAHRFFSRAQTVMVRNGHYLNSCFRALPDQLFRWKFTVVTVPAVHM